MKFLLLLTTIILFGCDFSSKPLLKLTKEQAVYETVSLKYMNSMVKEIKVLNRTNGVWFQEHTLEELKGVLNNKEYGVKQYFKAPLSMIENLYAYNNIESQDIDWDPIIVNGKLVSAEEHYPFNEKTERKEYSYYSFSVMVFSEDEREALVKFTHHCPVLCGGEWIIYLNFEDNQWKIIDTRALWIS
jgi:hypothetical protein